MTHTDSQRQTGVMEAETPYLPSNWAQKLQFCAEIGQTARVNAIIMTQAVRFAETLGPQPATTYQLFLIDFLNEWKSR